MYILKDDDCPIPIKYVDIQRRTETNLDAKAESTIRDFWTTDKYDGNPERQLSQPWIGRVVFILRRPDLGKYTSTSMDANAKCKRLSGQAKLTLMYGE